MTDKHRCYARSNVPWECAECGVSMDTLYLSDTFYLSEMRKRFAALEAERNEAVTKRLEAESREYKAAQPLVDEAFRQRDAMRVDVARLERELADEKRTSTHYADETMGLEREIADAHARINGVWRSKLESCESALVERTRERDEAVACTEKTRAALTTASADLVCALATIADTRSIIGCEPRGSDNIRDVAHRVVNERSAARAEVERLMQERDKARALAEREGDAECRRLRRRVNRLVRKLKAERTASGIDAMRTDVARQRLELDMLATSVARHRVRADTLAAISKAVVDAWDEYYAGSHLRWGKLRAAMIALGDEVRR